MWQASTNPPMAERLWSILNVVFVAVAALQGAEAGFCCTPSQWTSTSRILSQEFHTDHLTDVTESSIWQNVFYDAANKRLAYTTFKKNDVDTFERQILDYNKGEHYVIEGADQKKCVRHPLTEPFHAACVPDSNSTRVFFAGIQTIAENTAYFSENNVTGYVTITIVDCALVQEVTYENTDNVVTTRNIQYMNQSLSVDPSDFSLPKSCSHSTSALEGEKWHHYTMTGSFH